MVFWPGFQGYSFEYEALIFKIKDMFFSFYLSAYIVELT